MISNWKTTYTSDNEKIKDNYINSYNNNGSNLKFNQTYGNKSTIPDWFKHDYHTYHRTNYGGESIKSYGIHGDKPYEKFFSTSQGDQKLYSDNFNLASGTSKNTNFIPGYSGNYRIYYLFKALFL